MPSRRSHAVSIAFVLACVGGGCGGDVVEGGLVDVVETRPAAPPIAPATECIVTTAREPARDRAHRDPCSIIDYPRYPPAGGPHFGTWADFGTYTEPVETGYLVHSLEHGAVALLYNCPDGCPDVLDAFAAIAVAQADDVLCRDHPAGSRVIIAPDPTLEVAIAAVAWERLYLATCLDAPSLTAFVDASYAQAPEDLCAPGTTTPFCP